jgi:hypothetical protein
MSQFDEVGVVARFGLDCLPEGGPLYGVDVILASTAGTVDSY